MLKKLALIIAYKFNVAGKIMKCGEHKANLLPKTISRRKRDDRHLFFAGDFYELLTGNLPYEPANRRIDEIARITGNRLKTNFLPVKYYAASANSGGNLMDESVGNLNSEIVWYKILEVKNLLPLRDR